MGRHVQGAGVSWGTEWKPWPLGDALRWMGMVPAEVTDKRGTKDPQVSKGSHTHRPPAEPKFEGSGPAKVGLQLGRSDKPLTP